MASVLLTATEGLKARPRLTLALLWEVLSSIFTARIKHTNVEFFCQDHGKLGMHLRRHGNAWEQLLTWRPEGALTTGGQRCLTPGWSLQVLPHGALIQEGVHVSSGSCSQRRFREKAGSEAAAMRLETETRPEHVPDLLETTEEEEVTPLLIPRAVAETLNVYSEG